MNKYYVVALSCMVGHGLQCMEIEQVNDWKAKQYARNSELQYRAGMGALANIPLKGTERVMDIGSGDGRITANIADKVPNGSVLGIDISPNMIQHARDTHKRDNLSFDLQNIARSKNDDELKKQFGAIKKFDLITAFSSLSWVKDQQQAFTNIARLLISHDGMFRAGLAHEDSPYLRARFGMSEHPKWKQFFVNYEIPYYPSNEDKVRKMLAEANFFVVNVSKRSIPQTFATRQDFINWMSVIPAQLDRIPEDRHQEFLDDIVTEYLKEVPAKDDGSIDVAIGALVVHAATYIGIGNILSI